MRLAFLVVVGLAVSPASQAQDVAEPSPRSTFVVPTQPGEPVRITEYARRPPQQGRLSRRYRGVRVNRTSQLAPVASRFYPVSPIYATPRNTYVRRVGSFFPVAPRR